MNAEIQTLKTRLEQLEQRCERSEQRSEQSERRYQNAERRYQNAERRLRVQAALAFCAVIGAIFLSPANRAALAQGYGTTLQQLLARMIVVEGKTQFMSADAVARSTTFTGCNVFIQNGLGATNGNPTDPFNRTTSTTAVNGLGNLIVGYNESRVPFGYPDVRTGSHNIIGGNFQNYSSFGGLVVGRLNEISGPYASISGGESNRASGDRSSISGGIGNTANGVFSSVSGGLFNVASGTDSSVSGGGFNNASRYVSSISGGVFNNASGYFSSISGGYAISQSNDNGWAAGGEFGPGVFHSP